ncbi:MAG: methanol dehydrogenase, partial [Bacteroidetes bacterium]|nr:methanol dehydrogenase [Bacteroidota bacterium]
MSRLSVCFALAVLVLAFAAAPATLHAQPDVPPVGRVVDQAELLAPSTEQALTAQLAAHEDATSNQVAVLTLPSL